MINYQLDGGQSTIPGHTHLFDQAQMTFRTHVDLTFTFVGIAESVNKMTRLFADIINPLSTIGFRSSAAFDQRLDYCLRQNDRQ